MRPLTPELCCTEINTSLSFYIDIPGLSILYQRDEDGFALIECQSTQHYD